MIEIENFKQLDRGHLVGVADILIPEWRLKIQGVAIFNKNGAKWVNLPQKAYQGSDGKTKYTDTIRWTDKGVEGRFRDAVLRALEASGHLPPVEPAESPRRNQKNPDRMRFTPNYRPDDYPEITTQNDGIPY